MKEKCVPAGQERGRGQRAARGGGQGPMGQPKTEQEDYPGGTTKGVELPYDHARKKTVINDPPVKVGGKLKMKKIKEMLEEALAEKVDIEEKLETTLKKVDNYLDEMCGEKHEKKEEEVTETENEIDHEPELEPAEHLEKIRKDIGEMRQILNRLVEETEYQKFFKSMLSKYGVNSPAELDDAKKKEFFDKVDAEWKGEKEKN